MPVLIRSLTVVIGTVVAIVAIYPLCVVLLAMMSGNVQLLVMVDMSGVNPVVRHTARELYLALVIIHVTVPVH